MALPNVRLVAGRFLSEHPALTLPKAGPQREQALPEAKRPYRKRPRPGDEETITHAKEEILALKNSLNARNKELADLRTFWEPKHQEFLAMRAQLTRQSAHYTAISAEIKQLYEQVNQQLSTINDLSTGLKNATLSTKDLSAALKVATASSTCQTGPLILPWHECQDMKRRIDGHDRSIAALANERDERLQKVLKTAKVQVWGKQFPVVLSFREDSDTESLHATLFEEDVSS